ncbi:ribosomal RNA small subunit methyltransferase A, partial [Patescibacteria group bacterium]|nr:ribosomal RNA small subunit methyltransferase A [Patescibacteria group bacterium]
MIKHRAKKSLGQNFLKSESALRSIVEAGEISPKDIILEIGPGKGALTKQLLATSCQLIAVEKDHNLYKLLKNKFEKEILSGQLNLINGDILEFNPLTYKLKAVSYRLIANIPYNITGAILKKFLTNENQPKMMVLMVQNEVAKRIIGRGKNPSTPLRVKESILSVSVKAYGEPKMIMKVPARYFSPVPKVDSAVIAIKNISRKIFTKNKINEEKFWEIVHAGFAHKRKKLSNNLKNVIKHIPEKWKDKRAEDLKMED